MDKLVNMIIVGALVWTVSRLALATHRYLHVLNDYSVKIDQIIIGIMSLILIILNVCAYVYDLGEPLGRGISVIMTSGVLTFAYLAFFRSNKRRS